MITVREVHDLMARHVGPLAPISCARAEAHGRVLREPVAAAEDIPAFDRSAMDGYAVRADDTSKEFEVVGEIRAGDFIDLELKPGQAVSIFTGGRLPGARLKVVMQENVRVEGTRLRITKPAPESHVRHRSEDARAGEILLQPGVVLEAAAVALLASLGRTTVQVSPLPRILHLTTGDEIVLPEQAPAPGQIRNSNASLMAALCREHGAGEVTHFHARDDWDELLRIVSEAGSGNFDMVLVSGGSGPGAYDFTGKLLDRLGATIHSRQVNVRPGKPLIFGTIAQQAVFGLPGNALSHFVCFHLFVRRALDRLLDRPVTATLSALLAEDVADAGNARETWWPVCAQVESGRLECRALPWKSSGDITRLPGAHALMKVPASTSHLRAGTMVEILPTRLFAF